MLRGKGERVARKMSRGEQGGAGQENGSFK